MKKILVLGFLILISSLCFSVDHYVATGGGGLGTLASPFATIAQLDAHTLVAGDNVYFNRGNVWLEILTPSESGTSGSRITYGAYGTGALPIIGGIAAVPGSTTAGNWTLQRSNVYSIALTNYSDNRGRMWMDGTELRRAYSTADVNSSNSYYWGGNVLWIYSTSHPSTRSIKKSASYTYAAYIEGVNYLTFQNIDFRGGADSQVRVNSCNYVKFDGCAIGQYAAIYGLYISYSSNGEIVNCTIDSGDRIMDYWESRSEEDGVHIHAGSQNWIIHNNTFREWGHCCLNMWADETGQKVLDIDMHDNYFTDEFTDYGSAFTISAYLNCSDRIYFYRNNMYKMSTYNQINVVSGDFKFYNNIMNGTKGNSYKSDNTGFGVGILSYGATGGSHGVKIYNNTIVNCLDGGILVAGYSDGHVEHNEIINNLCYNNGIAPHNGEDPYYQLVRKDAGWLVLDNIFRNNLFYSSSSSDVVEYSLTPYTVAEFNALNGTENDVIYNNIGGNPLLTSSTNFHLLAGSSAIDMGYSPTLTSTDYDLVSWGTLPTIGAYEFVSGGGGATIPIITTTPLYSITTTGVGTGAVVLDNGGSGILELGVCWNIAPNPVITDYKNSLFGNLSSMAVIIGTMTPNTTYYLRAFGRNSIGTGYGEEYELTTLHTVASYMIKSGGAIMKTNKKIIRVVR